MTSHSKQQPLKISSKRLALLDAMLHKEGIESTAPQRIPRRTERNRSLPLSFAQQRLWFIDQLEPESIAYTIPAAIRLTGKLNVGALERTLTEVIRRHEVLRTTIRVVDGEPQQVVGAAEALSLPVIDLREIAAAEIEAAVKKLVAGEVSRPFDLARGPLLRVSLLEMGPEEHIVVFVMHHIISDGWSMGVLVRELSALYKAYEEGAESGLAELPIQYADYAVWQREWLQGAVLAEQLGYWKEQLRDAPTVLELPTDRARPAVQSYRGARQSVQLSRDLTEQLKQVSRAADVTLFMLLMGAFQVLLYRYSGQEEILIGTPIAGRTRSETEELIGFFVNTLVVKGSMKGASSFAEHLQQVREVMIGAYGHQIGRASCRERV